MLGGAATIEPVVRVAWVADDLLVFFKPGIEAVEWARDEPRQSEHFRRRLQVAPSRVHLDSITNS